MSTIAIHFSPLLVRPVNSYEQMGQMSLLESTSMAQEGHSFVFISVGKS